MIVWFSNKEVLRHLEIEFASQEIDSDDLALCLELLQPRDSRSRQSIIKVIE